MPPRRVPQVPSQQEPTRSINEEAQEAFNTGVKKTVTPRGGKPTELIIRQFYTDQAIEIMDQLDLVIKIVQAAANDKGDADLMEVFREAKEEVFTILMKAIERDRNFVGHLEIDDLLDLFGTVFNINKDFFVQRVKGRLTSVLGLASTIL